MNISVTAVRSPFAAAVEKSILVLLFVGHTSGRVDLVLDLLLIAFVSAFLDVIGVRFSCDYASCFYKNGDDRGNEEDDIIVNMNNDRSTSLPKGI